MIKVGQIYQDYSDGDIFVLSYKNNDTNFDIIYPNGEVGIARIADCKDNKLLAEYPTWQEAVNSQEFRGEECTKSI